MINLVLMAIVFYFLLRTGDLFKLVKLARKLVVDLVFSFKQQRQDTFQKDSPAEALKLRYVKREISEREYEMIWKNLF